MTNKLFITELLEILGGDNFFLRDLIDQEDLFTIAKTLMASIQRAKILKMLKEIYYIILQNIYGKMENARHVEPL